jgi:nitrogen fixation-related uncharacterized protein
MNCLKSIVMLGIAIAVITVSTPLFFWATQLRCIKT